MLFYFTEFLDLPFSSPNPVCYLTPGTPGCWCKRNNVRMTNLLRRWSTCAGGVTNGFRSVDYEWASPVVHQSCNSLMNLKPDGAQLALSAWGWSRGKGWSIGNVVTSWCWGHQVRGGARDNPGIHQLHGMEVFKTPPGSIKTPAASTEMNVLAVYLLWSLQKWTFKQF